LAALQPPLVINNQEGTPRSSPAGRSTTSGYISKRNRPGRKSARHLPRPSFVARSDLFKAGRLTTLAGSLASRIYIPI
jgi:hypothetical protein